MALPEATIIEVCKEAHADLKETYPELIPEWHELHVRLNNRQSALGVTFRSRATGKPVRIEMSRRLTERWAVDDTFRHEVAHWLTPGHNHDHVWKRMAVKCGANPNRCSHGGLDKDDIKPGNTIACPCGWSRGYLKRSKVVQNPENYICPKCKGVKLYSR